MARGDSIIACLQALPPPPDLAIASNLAVPPGLLARHRPNLDLISRLGDTTQNPPRRSEGLEVWRLAGVETWRLEVWNARRV